MLTAVFIFSYSNYLFFITFLGFSVRKKKSNQKKKEPLV